jgi:hypothetical protein
MIEVETLEAAAVDLAGQGRQGRGADRQGHGRRKRRLEPGAPAGRTGRRRGDLRLDEAAQGLAGADALVLAAGHEGLLGVMREADLEGFALFRRPGHGLAC